VTVQSAAERLADTLHAAAERGETWPCRDESAWISEDADERAEAARRCTGCSVSSLCRAAALEDPPTWGIWFGVDFGDREQRRAALRAGAA